MVNVNELNHAVPAVFPHCLSFGCRHLGWLTERERWRTPHNNKLIHDWVVVGAHMTSLESILSEIEAGVKSWLCRCVDAGVLGLCIQQLSVKLGYYLFLDSLHSAGMFIKIEEPFSVFQKSQVQGKWHLLDWILIMVFWIWEFSGGVGD